MKHARIPIFALLLAVLFLCRPAQAFNSSSFNGTADFYAGAAPPPGLHLIDYNVFLDIKKIENKGQGLAEGDGSLTAVAFRPIYVSDKGLFGGNFLMHSIIPILSVEANVTAQTPGGPVNVEGHDGGLGDVYFGVGMAWHTKTWHWLTVLDVITPTGAFDAKKPINAGNNAFIIEPVVAVTGLFDNGIEASAKLMYSYHTKNSKYVEAGTGLKGYQTGQAVHMDYMLNYAVAPSFKLGVTGWVWQGLEDDKIGGTKRPDTKDREFSIGPAARYQNGKFALLGKYVIPVSAENRIEANQTWIDLVYSF
ncbi:phenol degradation-like protein [Geoanaerobacter pelophilus]|uniref:Phenol degradation-like protein n=1 Tax=Geoanaerobacter pelophilus TaxID=60036 RepID=A0ABQ0ME11_9BACT|nr:transporter [Geoanaerobacter pelophilus]GAW65355.1 phenol degradation-like protein [Geoanaerobacter pelophilus]